MLVCRLQFVFTDPWHEAKYNRHTSPHLDASVRALQSDREAKLAATAVKAQFLTRREALIHGDLHTGSCMATESSYYVIDSEFAFFGPLAFDVGKLMANLLLTYFALAAYADTEACVRRQQREDVLEVRPLRRPIIGRGRRPDVQSSGSSTSVLPLGGQHAGPPRALGASDRPDHAPPIAADRRRHLDDVPESLRRADGEGRRARRAACTLRDGA